MAKLRKIVRIVPILCCASSFAPNRAFAVPTIAAATRGGRNDTSSGMDDADKMLDDILAESGTDRGYSSVAPSSQQAKYVTPGMMASAVDGDSYFMNFDDVKGINDDNYGKLPAKPDPNDAKKRAAEAARQRAAQVHTACLRVVKYTCRNAFV